MAKNQKESSVLVKKVFTNNINIDLPQRASVKKQSMEWKCHTDSPVKKSSGLSDQVNKLILTEFWDMKEPTAINFLGKGANLNNASYC